MNRVRWLYPRWPTDLVRFYFIYNFLFIYFGISGYRFLWNSAMDLLCTYLENETKSVTDSDSPLLVMMRLLGWLKYTWLLLLFLCQAMWYLGTNQVLCRLLLCATLACRMLWNAVDSRIKYSSVKCVHFKFYGGTFMWHEMLEMPNWNYSCNHKT